MDDLLLPCSGGINGGGMSRLSLGCGSETPAKGLDSRTASFAPRTWLVLETCFPKPLLDGKREPERSDPLGEQAVVAAVVKGIT